MNLSTAAAADWFLDHHHRINPPEPASVMFFFGRRFTSASIKMNLKVPSQHKYDSLSRQIRAPALVLAASLFSSTATAAAAAAASIMLATLEWTTTATVAALWSSGLQLTALLLLMVWILSSSILHYLVWSPPTMPWSPPTVQQQYCVQLCKLRDPKK